MLRRFSARSVPEGDWVGGSFVDVNVYPETRTIVARKARAGLHTLRPCLALARWPVTRCYRRDPLLSLRVGIMTRCACGPWRIRGGTTGGSGTWS